MARNLAYYMSPEDEDALLYGYGPPPPPAPPNLGVTSGRVPLVSDLVTPRRTDGDYSGFRDPYQDEEPTPEELAADAAHERAMSEKEAPVAGEDPLDVFITDVGRAANPYEEEAQAVAAAQQRIAPLAVDKRAATNVDEQKGVPAEEPAPVPMTVQVANNVIDDINRPPREYGSEAERMMGPQKGERSDLFGFDDEEGFSRAAQIKRVQELYGDSEPADGRYWEDEFLSRKKSISDSDVERGWLLQSLWHGQEAGNSFREMRRREQAGFEQGLSNARAQDFGNRRISRAMAEAIAATGQVSPEAAVNLRMNDPIVKNFGQYASQGGRAEGQAIGLSKKKLELMHDRFKAEDTDGRIKMLGVLQTIGGFEAAQLRAALLSTMSPEELQKVGAGFMASAIGVTPERGAAARAGDMSGLTPEQRRKAEIANADIDATLARPKVLDQVLSDRVKATVNAEQKRENAVEQSIALAQNDREFATKWQTDWDNAAMPLKEAIRSWKAMSPQGKEAFVEWTKQTKDPGSVFTVATVADQFNKKFTYAPGDQVHASKVLAAINSHVKAQAGSAVTGSEWDRIAARVGLATGTWAPFNDPSVVGAFLDDAAKLMTQDRQTYERTMGGWK